MNDRIFNENKRVYNTKHGIPNEVADDYCTGERRKKSYIGGTCPACGGELDLGRPGALSRFDNKTEIFSKCGDWEGAVWAKQFFELKRRRRLEREKLYECAVLEANFHDREE